MYEWMDSLAGLGMWCAGKVFYLGNDDYGMSTFVFLRA